MAYTSYILRHRSDLVEYDRGRGGKPEAEKLLLPRRYHPAQMDLDELAGAFFGGNVG